MPKMPPHKAEDSYGMRPAALPFGQVSGSITDEQAMALLAYSHMPVEHLIYQAMLAETLAQGTRVGCFSVQRLTILTGLKSYSTVRRGRAGLVNKLSIERQKVDGNGNQERLGAVYFVYSPQEIFARRRSAGLAPYPPEAQAFEFSTSFALAIERVVAQYALSRREAQVALCCAQGLSNAEIGEKLHICIQTVKFHLQHIFIKCGVKRRAGLIARLLMQNNFH